MTSVHKVLILDDEVFRISDTITLIRDGKYIKTVAADSIEEEQLIRDMVGRDASAFYSREFFESGETVLEVQNLSGNGAKNVSFTPCCISVHKQVVNAAPFLRRGRFFAR